MKKRFSFAVLLTIILGLLPSAMAFSQTYSISPTDYPRKAPSTQYAGSWTGYTTGTDPVWIESKAIQDGTLIKYYVKKSSGTFQNDASYRIMRDVKISGTSVTSQGTQVAVGSVSSGNRGSYTTFKPASGTHEYRAIVSSGSITFFTDPITIKGDDMTEQANLVLSSSPSFGTTNMVKGKSYTFSVNIKNNGSTTWRGGIYLKNGDDVLLKWGKSISPGSVIYLSDTYTPTTTGQMSLELFYQTDETGKGRTIPAGSYSNPFNVTVSQGSSTTTKLATPDKNTFKATNITETGFMASWDAVPGATKYDINYKLASEKEYKNCGIATSQTYYKISGLAPNTSYHFQVRARNDNSSQNSDWSASIPTAVTTKNAGTEPANLSIQIIKGFDGKTPLSVGKTEHYYVYVLNNSSSTWKGSFYLKEGKTDIKGWYGISLPGGWAQPLECDYTPESTGSKSLVLYYQTGGSGDGIPVSMGNNSSNLMLINVIDKEQTKNFDLKLKEAINSPTSVDFGKSYLIGAKVLNNSNSDWTGTLYLTENKISFASYHLTIEAGKSEEIPFRTWTPKAAGQQQIGVYYLTDGETNIKPVGANGFNMPVSIAVNNVNIPTTIEGANIRFITNECLPNEINEGDEAFCHFRITDKDGRPLKGLKARFNCSVAGKKTVIDSSSSDDDGYSILYLETLGNNSFAKRGETASFECTNIVDENSKTIKILNSEKCSFSLSVHQGNSFSRSTGFDDVESFKVTFSLGGTGKAEIGKFASGSVSLTFPLTTTFKWKDGALYTEITKEAKVEGEVSADILGCVDMKVGGCAGLKASTTYNWEDSWKTAQAIFMSWIGIDQLYTNKKVLRSIQAIESWFGAKKGTFDEYFKSTMEAKDSKKSSYYLGFTGGLGLNGLKTWPTKKAIGTSTLFPDLQIPKSYMDGKIKLGGEASAKFEFDKIEEDLHTNEMLFGVGKELKVKLYGDASAVFGGLSPAKPTLLNPIPDKSIILPEGLYSKQYSNHLGTNLNFSMTAKEEEMYTSLSKSYLEKISNSLELEAGVKLSAGMLANYLCPEWVKATNDNDDNEGKASTYIAIGMGWNWKITSKGPWAAYLQKLSTKSETRGIASSIYPVFSDKYAINAPITYYKRFNDQDQNVLLLNALQNASQTLDDSKLLSDDYKVKDVLKLEQQESEKGEMQFSLPLAKWGPINVTFDCGLSLGFDYYPSESYYSLYDKRFFPVVVRSTSSFASMCKKTTSFIRSKFNEAFGIEEQEEITEEYHRLGKRWEGNVRNDYTEIISNKNQQHEINPNSARIRTRSSMIIEQLQKDICTFTYTLNDGLNNFDDDTKIEFSHFYPAGSLIGITEQNDTIFVLSEVCDLSAISGTDILNTTKQGKIKLETSIGIDDLTPFGFSENTPLAVYQADLESDTWHYVGDAGTTLMVDRLGSYMIGTSIKNDNIVPKINVDFDNQTGIIHIKTEDNIGLRLNTMSVIINGEKKDIRTISETNFEVDLTEEDMQYMLNLNVSIYDLAGNLGTLSQVFQIDKPEKVNFEYQADTDVSLLENTIYVDPVSAKTGGEVTLSVKMKNSVQTEGFQFDLELPEGVTVAKDADGFPEAYLSTARTTLRKTNYFDSSFLENGALRVVAGSTNGSTIDGNDGEVVTIILNVTKNVPAGSYPILIRNIAISDTNSDSHNVAYVKSTMTVSSGVLGDANGNGTVGSEDITAIVNYIMSGDTTNFIFENADLNTDGNVDAADLVRLIKMVNP